MARDAAQGQQAEGTELEAGTSSSVLGDPSPSTDCQPLGALSFNFSSYIYPHPLPPPRTQLSTRRGRTPSGSAANTAAAPLAGFLLRDRRLPGQSPAHTPSPSRTQGWNLAPQLRAPLRHLTHPAPGAAIPLAASRQPRLRAPTSAKPSRSLEPRAFGQGCGKWRGPGGARRGGAGP